MPELVCLSLPLAEVEARLKLPADAATLEWETAWRAQVLDIGETLCFTCNEGVPTPPKLLILPDYIDPKTRLLVLLCPPCCALPTQVKYAKALKIIRPMYKATPGRRLNLIFTPPQR